MCVCVCNDNIIINVIMKNININNINIVICVILYNNNINMWNNM